MAPVRKRKLPKGFARQKTQSAEKNITTNGSEEILSLSEQSSTPIEFEQLGSSQKRLSQLEPLGRIKRKVNPMYRKLNRAIGTLSTRMNILCEEIRASKSTVRTQEEFLESGDIIQEQNVMKDTTGEEAIQEQTMAIEGDLTNGEYKKIIYNVRNINLEKPKFGDKELNPVTFLEDLELYLRRSGRENNEIDIIQECLVGDARDWARIYKSGWKDLSDFKKDFLTSFWGDKEQNDLRRSIVQGTWDKSTTMLNHFLRITGKAQLLTFKIPEKQLISDLIRHYPKYIQQGWYISKIETIIDTAEFLRSMDNVNKQETPNYTPPRFMSGQNREHDKRRRETQQNYQKQWNKPEGNYETGKRVSAAVINADVVNEIPEVDLN